jgi:hypothetical protein
MKTLVRLNGVNYIGFSLGMDIWENFCLRLDALLQWKLIRACLLQEGTYRKPFLIPELQEAKLNHTELEIQTLRSDLKLPLKCAEHRRTRVAGGPNGVELWEVQRRGTVCCHEGVREVQGRAGRMGRVVGFMAKSWRNRHECTDELRSTYVLVVCYTGTATYR